MADRKTKRRGNGEGSIFQRADGRWCAKLAVGTASAGKRLRKTVYGKTKLEVQGKLGQLQNRRSRGQLVASGNETVGQYLDRWIETVPKIKDTTRDRYRDLIRLHIKPRIGGVRVARLTVDSVHAFYDGLEDAGVKGRMRQLIHTVLQRALPVAVTWDQVHRPQAAKREMLCLDMRQTQAFLAIVRDNRLAAMYTLAVITGARQGELFGLQWENIKLTDGWLSIRHTLTSKGQLTTPKTKSSIRRIELPALAVESLWTHRRRLEATGQPATGFVFRNTAGGLLSRPNVRRSFQALLTKAGLPIVRFHDLRHTAATLMLAEGVSPKVVQELLGHSKVQTTLDLYCHVLPTMQREAMDRLNLRLAGGKSPVGTLRVHIRHKRVKRVKTTQAATLYSGTA